MITLIAIRHVQIGNQQFDFGQEIPPNLLPREVIDEWLDQKWLYEMDAAERPSLYRLFSRFSGTGEEQALTQEQIDKFCLEE